MEQLAFTAADQQTRLSLARACLNKAANLLRQVEGDMAHAEGDEEQELSWIAADVATKAEAARSGVKRWLGEE